MGACISCCCYPSIENQYFARIYVKIDVQQPFPVIEKVEGDVEAGAVVGNIRVGGRRMKKNEWVKVKSKYTDIKPGHSFERTQNIAGNIFLTIITDNKDVNIHTWPVDASTSWLITNDGELKRKPCWDIFKKTNKVKVESTR